MSRQERDAYVRTRIHLLYRLMITATRISLRVIDRYAIRRSPTIPGKSFFLVMKGLSQRNSAVVKRVYGWKEESKRIATYKFEIYLLRTFSIAISSQNVLTPHSPNKNLLAYATFKSVNQHEAVSAVIVGVLRKFKLTNQTPSAYTHTQLFFLPPKSMHNVVCSGV